MALFFDPSQFLHLAEYGFRSQFGPLKWRLRQSRGAELVEQTFALHNNLLFFSDVQTETIQGFIFLEEADVYMSKSDKDGFSFRVSVPPNKNEDIVFFAATEKERADWVSAIASCSFRFLKESHLGLINTTKAQQRKIRKMSMVPMDSLAGINKEEDTKLENVIVLQKFVRAWIIRKRWKQIVSEFVKSPYSKQLRRRNEVLSRLRAGEEAYVDCLQVLNECFHKPLRTVAQSSTPFVSLLEVRSIFLNCETLLFLHQFFLLRLESCFKKWPKLELLDLLESFVSMLSIYSDTVKNYDNSLSVLAELRKNDDFVSFLRRCEQNPCCKGRTLRVLLEQTSRRITFYVEHTREVLDLTPPEHITLPQMEALFTKLKETQKSIMEQVSETQHVQRLLSIEALFQGECVQELLDNPSRRLIGEGKVFYKKNASEWRPRDLFLFHDMVMFARRTESGELVWGHGENECGTVHLLEATIEEDIPDDPRCFNLIAANGKKSCFRALNEADKANYVADMQQCIAAIAILMNKTLSGSTISRSSSMSDIADSEISFCSTPKHRRDTTHQSPQVRAGTLVKVISLLTDANQSDVDFLNTFLLTYRTFLTPIELLDHIIKRYFARLVTAENVDSLKKLTPAQLRCASIVKHWITKFDYDFRNNDAIIDKLFSFFADMVNQNDSAERLAANLKQTLEKRVIQPPLTQFTIATTTLSSKARKLVENNFVDTPPRVIAEQLALIESRLYQAITPPQLLKLSWTKKSKEETAPNVLAMIAHFNAISGLTASFVVSERDFKKRVHTMAQFINIAAECRALGNFNATMEILSGLNQSSVFRLKKTWAELEPSVLAKFEQLKQEMAPESSYKKFRDTLHHINPPCIPYLGVYLTDLTFIEDGNNDLTGDGSNLVNFAKLRMVAAVIREVQQYQQIGYAFAEDGPLLSFLSSPTVLNEDEAYKLSLEAEPRG